MNSLSIHQVTKVTLDDATTHTLKVSGKTYAVRSLQIETKAGTFQVTFFADDVTDLGIAYR